MSWVAVLALAVPCVVLHLPNVCGVSEYYRVEAAPGPGRAANESAECRSPPCVVKCCGAGLVLHKNKATGHYVCTSLTALATTVDYNVFNIYGKDINNKRIVNKTMLGDFTFVTNDVYSPNNTNMFLGSPKVNLLFVIEDGTLVMEHPHFYDRWTYYDRLNFCVEILVTKKRIGNSYVKVMRIGTLRREDTSSVGDVGLDFAVTGYAVSCLFMALVVAVHGALPQLRNIAGMMRLGYVVTLMALYILKAAQITGGRYGKWRTSDCVVISTMAYFLFLSSFFWLNVMSFDIWWTFRGTRKCRAIHRRGETVKFLWYCLYAWGAPLAVTALAAGIDRDWVTEPAVIKIHFDQCFTNVKEVLLYMYVPVMIMTVVNCTLFLMTVYNIWLVKRAARELNSKDSHTTQKNESVFNMYLKLSLLMGVSWVMDIIQFLCDIAPWTFFVFNFYNFFIGVPIFIIFVFNKKTIVMLCRRFSINCRYLDRMQSTTNGRTTTATDSFKSSRNPNTAEYQLDAEQTEAFVTETKI